MQEEIFPVVNSEGEVIGSATRSECHAKTFILHPVVHLHIFNSKGELYLQKRVMTKKIQPGKWDTAVGGHVDYGENVEDALLRETREELGVVEFKPEYLMRYEFRSSVEAELVYIYRCVYDWEFVPNPAEVDEGRLNQADIEAFMTGNITTYDQFDAINGKLLSMHFYRFMI